MVFGAKLNFMDRSFLPKQYVNRSEAGSKHIDSQQTNIILFHYTIETAYGVEDMDFDYIV